MDLEFVSLKFIDIKQVPAGNECTSCMYKAYDDPKMTHYCTVFDKRLRRIVREAAYRPVHISIKCQDCVEATRKSIEDSSYTMRS